ncbi:2-hydroxyisoflavanone dehydratase-like [Andrographis paniculata]|uniref:2-hydroxyisoflavanone dehydratase-like n=1 Tax=Andrographis paniculata TaxID=175694 RepID=UPI0021E8BFAD|nr:2-hydroxyisoflavanone dehydratase-like [Andrographis paniculata]
MAATKEVLTDLSPVIKLYTDGTVDRLMSSPYVPPSPLPDDSATGVSTRDAVISPTVSARLHLPKLAAGQKLPILVYYHAGGFCIGSAFSLLDHRYMNTISAAAAALAVSVDYRLAPEHPLPAAYDDAWDALNWVCSHAVAVAGSGHPKSQNTDQWISDHGDFSRLFIAGDSAGGNIAHHMALRAGSDSLPGNVKIRGAILSHPYFLMNSESEENWKLRFLERMWRMVWPAAGGGIDSPMINPVADGAPDLSGLGCSRIQICVSEKDALRDGGITYAEKVKSSGWKGEIVTVQIDGEDHCFQLYDPHTDNACKLITKIASFISKLE